jgi:malate dehydrogenase (oxaloacetate-decarboxylating)(NADP+)
VSSRKESLQHFKKPWAHDHEPVKELVDAVNVRSLSPILSLMHARTYTHLEQKFQISHASIFSFQQIKPTVLIGTSGQGRTFTQEVIEAMASINEVHC